MNKAERIKLEKRRKYQREYMKAYNARKKKIKSAFSPRISSDTLIEHQKEELVDELLASLKKVLLAA